MEHLDAVTAEHCQRRAAGALRHRRIAAGERIALIATNSAAMLNCALGALRSGVIPVVINPALLPHEQDALIADAQVRCVVRDADLPSFADSPAIDIAPMPLARPMHYTSGTTGAPKGVWSGLLDETDAALLLQEEREAWGFVGSDVHLVCSPLCHSAPLRFAAGTLFAGGEVVILERFEAQAAAQAIHTYHPTSAFMVPAHLQRLFALDPVPSFASFRLLAHAGAPCPERLKHQILEAFPEGSVWEFYGATEGQFSVCSGADWLQRPGTVGRARPQRQLTVDADGTIWCMVPPHARFSYWNAPEKTQAAWRGDAFTVGDLGHMDEDGFLYLSGRRDDLIISGGVNVYPAEVEQVLARMPGIDEVAVFPVADARWGQRVCAAVVGDVTDEDVRTFAQAQLAPYKRPKQVFTVTELPYTATGKIRRAQLAAFLGLE